MAGSGMSTGAVVSVAELLAHDAWVQRLARTLVAGHAVVDAADVAQETWRRVLAQLPRHRGHLRAWLASIARNVVRRGRRDDATRARHEARAGEDGAALPLSPPAAEVVERVLLQRRVADAVLALDEPYPGLFTSIETRKPSLRTNRLPEQIRGKRGAFGVGNSSEQGVLFASGSSRRVLAAFDEPETTSDGGAVLLQAVDRRMGLTARLAGAVRERVGGERNAESAITRSEENSGRARLALVNRSGYRSTLLLRFFDDLAPGAIAERTAVPVETVKTRLKRGLAQLRNHMQREFAGDERSLNAALLFLGGNTLVVSKAMKVGFAASALIALAATLPLLVRSGGRTPDGATMQTPLATPAEVRAHAGESATASEADRSDDLGAPVAVREEVTHLRPDQLLVEVIDAVTRAPVAGARVAWADQSELGKLRERQGGAEPHDDTELLHRFGATGVTDRRGRLVIARPGSIASFSAEHDGRWALCRDVGMKRAESVTLELSADDCVRVKVVDRGGRPVPDVAVAFGGEGLNLGNQSRRAWTRAPDGVALIRDLRAYLHGFSGNDRPWCVMLLVPSLDAVTARVDPERPPKEPLVLTLPDGGSMTFSFTRRDLKPVDVPLDVGLVAFPWLDPAMGGGSVSRRSLLERTLHTRDGKLDLACIGPGVDLWVTAKIDGALVAQEHFLRGPVRAGEHVDVTLHADVGPVRFLGELVNDAEQALYATEFSLHLAALGVEGGARGAKELLRAAGRTDRSGRFELLIDVPGPLGTEVRFELFVSLDGDTTTVIPMRHRVVDCSAPIDIGRVVVPRS